jgi:methionine-rich copper-binding protein CopC
MLVADAVDAHAFLVRTSPPKRAVLRESPKQVELWFSERLEPAFATLTISDRTGSTHGTRPAAVGGDDRRRLTLELPTLPPGTYTVQFRVLSVDGHVVEDSFTFTVR